MVNHHLPNGSRGSMVRTKTIYKPDRAYSSLQNVKYRVNDGITWLMNDIRSVHQYQFNEGFPLYFRFTGMHLNGQQWWYTGLDVRVCSLISAYYVIDRVFTLHLGLDSAIVWMALSSFYRRQVGWGICHESKTHRRWWC